MYGLRLRKRTMEPSKKDLSFSDDVKSESEQEGSYNLEEGDDENDSWFKEKSKGSKLGRPKKSPKKESSDESEQEPFISEYERIRLQNIAERNQLLRSMGITVSEESSTPTVPVKRTRDVKRVKKEVNPPMRMSLRLRGKSTEKPFIDESFIKEPEPDIDSRNLGSEGWAEDELKGREQLLNDLKDKLGEIDFTPGNLDLTSCSQECLRDVMLSLVVKDTPRVLSTRIQALCVHPSTSKRVVFAGSKSGALGIWDMDCGGEDDCIELQPCHAPINCITVDDYSPNQIYLTSHEGTLTLAHVDTNQFVNIYATPYEDRINHITWHHQMNSNSFLVAHGDGRVLVVDKREKKDSQRIKCFQRSVRTVQIHPTQDKYFLASSGSVGLGGGVFDLRTRKEVSHLDHDKGLTSAFFSASGTRIITTCNDDTVKLFDSSSLDKIKQTNSVCHNNHTGRWLSVFKAQWYPGRDDVFHIGSLLQPRRIQIYSENGSLLAEVRSDEVMATVQPVIAVHQSLPLLVGGNSSGRLHAFAPPI